MKRRSHGKKSNRSGDKMLGKSKKMEEGENPSWLLEEAGGGDDNDNDNDDGDDYDAVVDLGDGTTFDRVKKSALQKDPDEQTQLLFPKSNREETRTKRGDVRVRKKCMHLYFDLVSMVTTIVALCMLLSQVLPLVFDRNDEDSDSALGLVQMALRIYMGIFCVGAICAEQEVLVINKIPILHSWMIRGLTYSFLGLIGLEQSVAVNFNEDGSSSGRHASLFIKFSSFALTFMGLLYFVMGLLCMRNIRKNAKKEYDLRLEKEKIRQDIFSDRKSVV